MNKTILIGNLTKDPETMQVNNKTLCKLNIAVNRLYTTAAGEHIADYFNVAVWEKQADNCAKYLKKGKKIAVVGELRQDSYTDKNGVKRNTIEIQANEIEFLTPSKE